MYALIFIFVLGAALAQVPEGIAYEYERSLCSAVPCVHGTCAAAGDEAKCLCDPGWVGDLCETPSCHDRGQLHDDKCFCLPGYDPQTDCAECTPVEPGYVTICVEYGRYFRRIDLEEYVAIEVLSAASYFANAQIGDGYVTVNGEKKRAYFPAEMRLDCACSPQDAKRDSHALAREVFARSLMPELTRDTVSQEAGEARWMNYTVNIGALIMFGTAIFCGVLVAWLYTRNMTNEELQELARNGRKKDD